MPVTLTLQDRTVPKSAAILIAGLMAFVKMVSVNV